MQNAFVQYAACKLFELRSTPTGPKMEIFYKKSIETDEATPLTVKSFQQKNMQLNCKNYLPTLSLKENKSSHNYKSTF